MAIITGDSVANTLNGGLEADTITGGGGNDTIAGSEGLDVAVFGGNAAGYRFSWSSGKLRVTDTNSADGSDGADFLSGIETLRFADRDFRVSPVGEFRVNATTANDQGLPVVTALANGTFVVVWQSALQDGSGAGIYAQRLDARGNTIGGEFRVNSYVTSSQDSPAVAALGDGGFVVAWESSGQDGSGEGVYAQRYDAGGVAVGGEFLVNQTTVGGQYSPAITALGTGFAVSWYSDDQDGSGFGVYARIFDAAGSGGTEFRVNTQTSDDQFDSSMAALKNGNLVVTWTAFSQDGSQTGVYAQIFDATGQKVGSEFRANVTTSDYQDTATVTVLANGDFVVAWESNAQDGSGDTAVARIFAADGTPVSGELQLNATTANAQGFVSLAALAGGGFVATWMSELQDGSGEGVYARVYSASGVAATGEILVNSSTAGNQTRPSVSASSDGGFLVTWESASQDGSGKGVYARRFDAAGNDLAPSILGSAQADTIDLRGDTTLEALGGRGDDTYWVSGQNVLSETATGGHDTVYSSVSFTLATSIEDLRLTGTAGIDGTGNNIANSILGNDGANRLSGLGGADDISGAGGNDTLDGGVGADTLRGGAGDDYYVYSAGDTLVESVGAGYDVVESAANVTLGANLEELRLAGTANLSGNGNGDANLIIGNTGANILKGRNGDDTLQGGAGNDRLYGQADADALLGGDGKDTLSGAEGSDVLTGGAGIDFFQFDTAPVPGEFDTITDFASGSDRIRLDDDVFTAFDATVSAKLAASQLLQGAGATVATDADHRIIYDTSTGALYYDADGNLGGSSAVQFAQLGTGSHPASLLLKDFAIVG